MPSASLSTPRQRAAHSGTERADDVVQLPYHDSIAPLPGAICNSLTCCRVWSALKARSFANFAAVNAQCSRGVSARGF